MQALETALFAAFLALVAKIISDLWQRDHDRRGLAGALAGEIAAYIEPLQALDMPISMRIIAKLDREERRRRLSGFPALPNTHPVFDVVAAKIGVLPPNHAKDISAFYNTVTGFRLQMSNFSSERFLDADDLIQQGSLNEIARIVEFKLGPATKLVDALLDESRRSCFRPRLWRWFRSR